uniref:Uncharacterized protein n=1 Tax=Daphnia galeata TaxID=27404 RepID=A0A8J2S0F8_9CRUS|nr:unnamed protein product [Daphnia galeata]
MTIGLTKGGVETVTGRTKAGVVESGLTKGGVEPGATGSSFKVKVTQLPCVSALVLITGHKIQGRILDAVILGALSRIHKSGRSGWIYVILSRVRILNGLFLLTLLETDPKKYPRTDVMTEMNRLHLIEKSTLARLGSC